MSQTTAERYYEHARAIQDRKDLRERVWLDRDRQTCECERCKGREKERRQ